MSAACPVYGFHAEFDLSDELTADEIDELRTAFVAVIEARGLVCGDGGLTKRWSCAIQSEASQATDADRLTIERWAWARREIVGVRVGPLIDFQSAA